MEFLIITWTLIVFMDILLCIILTTNENYPLNKKKQLYNKAYRTFYNLKFICLSNLYYIKMNKPTLDSSVKYLKIVKH